MNTQKLRELSQAATQEKWYADSKGQIWRRPLSELYQYGGGVAGDKPIASTTRGWYGEDTKGYPHQENAAYIAAACPANILALLDSRDALLAALKKIESIGSKDVITGFKLSQIAHEAITKAEAL